MKKEDFTEGFRLLKQPVLPLVGMVQFFYGTGDFATVAEIIAEIPEPVETGYALYERPRQLLNRYLGHLRLLEEGRAGKKLPMRIVDEAGNELDEQSSRMYLINQSILEDELAAINSLLCAPCECSLCCVGPEAGMEQEFFEIPLLDREVDLFSLDRHDSSESRRRLAMDEEELQINGRSFYDSTAAKMVNWQNGWSMILPTASSCPALGNSGRCRVYAERPRVCRRPQIFSYILEETSRKGEYMLRNALLAVVDCPYVQCLREEIGAYAAACELDLVLKENKR